jgi:hypothetical protein
MLPPMSPAGEQAANEALYDRLRAGHAWLAPAVAEVDLSLVRCLREQEAGRAASERR